MSALARYFKTIGKNVSGYDKTPSMLTDELIASGIDIHFEDRIDLIPAEYYVENTLVIITPAVPVTHSQWNYFLEREYEVKKRAEVLGIITKDTFCFAVAGTHGKTTTSSILGHILFESGADVTAFVGGIVENYNSNLIGTGKTVTVVEADEFDRSFLHLHPNIACVTSMDADHLDIYGDAKTFEQGFQAFAKKVEAGGKIWSQSSITTEWVELASNVEVLTYSNGNRGNCRAENIRIEEGKFVFDYIGSENIPHVQCGLAGVHNIENAVAAISVGLHLGCDSRAIAQAVSTFKGVSRRFERVYSDANHVVIDDYAHHPTEIKAAIASARMLFEGKKMGVIFQPHLFTRTRDFLDGFANELSKADAVILLPIYPARELPLPGVDSQSILDKILISDKKVLEKSELLEIGIPADWEVVMFLGAGDIDQLVRPICQGIQEG